MARVSKANVMKAFEHVAKLINDAGGPDKITSRKDLKAKLKTLNGTERALFDVYSRFVDHRDHKPGARITAKDVQKALAYTAKEMVADRDEGRKNGLSKAEIAKGSTSLKLAVKLAQEMGLLQSKRDPINATEQSGRAPGGDAKQTVGGGSGIWMGTKDQRQRLFTSLAQERMESGAAKAMKGPPAGIENAENYRFGPQGADVGSTVYVKDSRLYVESITIAGPRWFDAGPAPMIC